MILSAEHITCGYGGPPVVKDVSFSLREGERLAILGPHGRCGRWRVCCPMRGPSPSWVTTRQNSPAGS